MTDLAFEVVDSIVDPFTVSPMLVLRVRLREQSGTKIAAIALRTQIRIEVQRRNYDPAENEMLVELFGEPSRYGDTLKPLLWTHVAQSIVGFEGETHFDLEIPCSYDFEVAANKYFASLKTGIVPISLLFNGQIFVDGPTGVTPEFVPWNAQARYALPLATWRKAVDAFFPNAAWIRVDRDVFDEVRRFKSAMGLRSWDATLTRLCEIAREQAR